MLADVLTEHLLLIVKKLLDTTVSIRHPQDYFCVYFIGNLNATVLHKRKYTAKTQTMKTKEEMLQIAKTHKRKSKYKRKMLHI